MSNKLNNQIKIPHCKVCFDAGKPESLYSNHWVKDLTGKTTCPTLLSLNCRFCGKKGHTVKFCSKLLKQNKQTEYIERKEKNTQSKTEETQKLKLAVLFEESDDENEKEDFPEIVKTTKAVPELDTEQVVTWASIASKPKQNEVQHIVIFKQEKPQKSSIVVEKKLAPWAIATTTNVNKRWIEFSDDEDDEDEDEDYKYECEYEYEY